MGTELNNAVFVTPSTKIRFKCTGCGECCRHVKESVPVSCQDAFYMAKYLRLLPEYSRRKRCMHLPQR